MRHAHSARSRGRQPLPAHRAHSEGVNSGNTPSRTTLVARSVLGTALALLLYAVLLFGPAVTLNWPRAWQFLAAMMAINVLSIAGLLRTDPALLNERLKPPIQKEQPQSDKVLVGAMMLSFIGVLAFIPVDVFHLHLLPSAPPEVCWAGLALFCIGWWLIYRAMRENSFAAPVVKYQGEREQVVVDTGPYAIVRHPLYVGGVLHMVGTPLWFGSYAAALACLLPIGLLIARIYSEERFLRQKLAGYTEYAQRVRFRLIPFVW